MALDRFVTPASVLWVTWMYEAKSASATAPFRRAVTWRFVPWWRSGYGLSVRCWISQAMTSSRPRTSARTNSSKSVVPVSVRHTKWTSSVSTEASTSKCPSS